VLNVKIFTAEYAEESNTHHAPGTKPQINSNIATQNSFDIWSLVIGTYLGFGI
jgi:hypothetical protein